MISLDVMNLIKIYFLLLINRWRLSQGDEGQRGSPGKPGPHGVLGPLGEPGTKGELGEQGDPVRMMNTML